jgi:hypothetical protein
MVRSERQKNFAKHFFYHVQILALEKLSGSEQKFFFRKLPAIA